MAKLSAHGATVLDRFKRGNMEYVLRSDGAVLRRFTGKYRGSYVITRKDVTPEHFAAIKQEWARE